MRQDYTFAWEKFPFFSKEWKLNRDEKNLLGEKLEVKSLQNPKAWKAEMLRQKTSNTEDYSQNTSYALTSNSTEIVI